MAAHVNAIDEQQRQPEGGPNGYKDFLDAISRGTKDDVERFLQQANSDKRRDSRDKDPTFVYIHTYIHTLFVT